MIKAYKSLENNNIIFYVHNNQTVKSATPKTEHLFISNHTLERLIEKGDVEEINLLDEKWIHPHLYKPVKKLVYSELVK